MNKSFLILTLASGLCFSTNIHPMAWIAANLSKECLKKAVEKVTTGLHWGISAAPILFETLVLTQTENAKRNIRAENEEYFRAFLMGNKLHTKQECREKIKEKEEWIRQELQSLGYSDWKTVDLVPYFQFAAFSVPTKSLFYDMLKIVEAYNEQHPSGQLSELDKLIKNRKEKYNELRASLSHEMSHLENNDSVKAMSIGFTMPFITHFLSKKIATLTNLKITNFALKNSLKVLSGFGKLAINVFPIWAYSSYAEKKADENVINDIEILEGAARIHKEYAKYESYADTKNLTLQERLRKLIGTHEDSSKRAQRFEERIAQLKKSQVSK
jgi:hypothetical protein